MRVARIVAAVLVAVFLATPSRSGDDIVVLDQIEFLLDRVGDLQRDITDLKLENIRLRERIEALEAKVAPRR